MSMWTWIYLLLPVHPDVSVLMRFEAWEDGRKS